MNAGKPSAWILLRTDGRVILSHHSGPITPEVLCRHAAGETLLDWKRISDGEVLRKQRRGGLSPLPFRSVKASARCVAVFVVTFGLCVGSWRLIAFQKETPDPEAVLRPKQACSPAPSAAPSAGRPAPAPRPSAPPALSEASSAKRRAASSHGTKEANPAETGEPGPASDKQIQARNFFIRGRLENALSALKGGSELSKFEPDSDAARLETEIRYALCRRAEQTGRYHEAGEQCARALQCSEHARARELIESLEARSRKLFLEGYVMEGVDPKGAKERYRQAEEVAPPGGSYAEKAREKLREGKRTEGR
ncbi:MAG: hypothetical protein V1798_04170 [Pseudomonadota bacterium]